MSCIEHKTKPASDSGENRRDYNPFEVMVPRAR